MDPFKSTAVLKALAEQDVLEISPGRRFVFPASVVQQHLDCIEKLCQAKSALSLKQPRHAILSNRLKHWHATRAWSAAPFVPRPSTHPSQVAVI